MKKFFRSRKHNELSSFLDCTSNLVFWLDSNLNIIHVNEMTEKTFLLKNEAGTTSFSELLKKYASTPYDVFIDDLNSYPSPIEKNIGFEVQNQFFSVDFHVLKFSLEQSKELYFLVTGMIHDCLFKTEDETEFHSVASTWDLGSILSESALSVPTAFFRSIIAGMPGFIFWKDTNSVYKGCNNNFLELYGFESVDQVIGLTDADIAARLKWPAKFVEKFCSDDKKVISKRKVIAFEDTVLLDGRKECILLDTKAPIFNEENEVIGVFGIAQDITKHRKREVALKQAKEAAEEAQVLSSELDAIIRYAPDFIYWKDRDSVHLGCNERFAVFAGLKSREEVIGKTDFDFPWKAEAKSFQKDDAEVIRTGKPKLNIQDFMLNSVGATAVVITNKVPLRNKEGDVIGVFGIATDVTKLKETEEKLRQALHAAELASRSKSEFIANMSHDIRTPITGVIGMLQDLLYTADDTQRMLESKSFVSSTEESELLEEVISRMKKNSTIALGSINELLQLCNEILEVTRLETGKVDQQPEAFSLRKLINHNIDLLQSVAEHRSLNLSAEIDDRIPDYLKGLRQYLDRTLLNLISNALKFTKKGNVKIITALHDVSNSAYTRGDPIILQIRIEDTGIGIPEDKIDSIFEHFSRLTASYQGVYKGSGLGLYTVRCYVEAMQGNIEVDSEVGKGTRFTLTLPFVVDDHADQISKSTSLLPELNMLDVSEQSITSAMETSDTSKFSKAHVLLVEDNPGAAMAAELLLNRLECLVEIANDGREAVKKATDNYYDLIFMDVGLPDIDGVEVTKQIRALSDARKSRVPIVALTGHASDQKRQKCLEAGMFDVLSKPAQAPHLQSALQQWVWRKQSPEQDLSVSAASNLPSDPELPVLDWGSSVVMCMGDEQIARRLLEIMVKDLKKTARPVLSAAYSKKDWKTLRAELHRVLGGVVYLKLPQLEYALKAFQVVVKAVRQDPDAIEVAYKSLQNAIDAFLTLVEKEGF